MEFERLGVFTYSKEEGTVAAKMSTQIRKDTKEKRKDALMSAQREISLRQKIMPLLRFCLLHFLFRQVRHMQ